MSTLVPRIRFTLSPGIAKSTGQKITKDSEPKETKINETSYLISQFTALKEVIELQCLKGKPG